MLLPEAVKRLARATLAARLLLSRGVVGTELAYIAAYGGALGHRHVRAAMRAAAGALGTPQSGAEFNRFLWDCWYQRFTDEIHAYQMDRLTDAWLQRHVAAPVGLPRDGCLLMSVHHYNQRLAFARIGAEVKELGAVSMFVPLPADDPYLEQPPLTPAQRVRARSRFAHRVFGPRVFIPPTAARRGLELLRRGGYLVVLPDTLEGGPSAGLFGRQMAVADGAAWLAERSGRPLVPFVVQPDPESRHRWRVWCGEPIPPTRPAVVSALEDCVRHSASTWMQWRIWYAASAAWPPSSP